MPMPSFFGAIEISAPPIGARQKRISSVAEFFGEPVAGNFARNGVTCDRVTGR